MNDRLLNLQRVLPWARLLQVFVIRELREQYAGTLLGGVWAVLQPLLLVAIYWWVFGLVWALKVPLLGARTGEVPFIVFLLSGLLPWLAFQDGINRSAAAVLARADVLRHGNFPVVVFPIAHCVAAHLVFLGLIVGFALLGRGAMLFAAPGLAVGLLFLYLVQLTFACGLGMLVSALAVYIRDLPHLLAMGLTCVFFTAPVLYPLAQIPDAMRSWVWLNPFTPFALGYHALLLEGRLPAAPVWAYVLIAAASAWAVGLFVFRRLRPGFADVV